jgi:hypothetical protein
MFLSAELMLQGVSVTLVAWSRYHGDWGGQVLVVFVLTVVRRRWRRRGRIAPRALMRADTSRRSSGLWIRSFSGRMC